MTNKEEVSFQWSLFYFLLNDATWVYAPWKWSGEQVVRAESGAEKAAQ